MNTTALSTGREGFATKNAGNAESWTDRIRLPGFTPPPKGENFSYSAAVPRAVRASKYGSPWASAIAGWVTFPLQTLMPLASAGWR